MVTMFALHISFAFFANIQYRMLSLRYVLSMISVSLVLMSVLSLTLCTLSSDLANCFIASCSAIVMLGQLFLLFGSVDRYNCCTCSASYRACNSSDCLLSSFIRALSVAKNVMIVVKSMSMVSPSANAYLDQCTCLSFMVYHHMFFILLKSHILNPKSYIFHLASFLLLLSSFILPPV